MENQQEMQSKLKKRHHKGKSYRKNIFTSNLSEMHFNFHSGKEPFKCETCGKYFKYKSKFNVHLRVHTGEKPYSCDTCGKRFCQISGLNAHMSIHTGDKPYSCDTCGKDFRFGSRLKSHMRTHTDDKSLKNIKRQHPPQPRPVHPAAVRQAIQKYPPPYGQIKKQLLSPN